MPWNRWSAERLGIAFAVLAAVGSSFKAIFVKLAYASAPVEAITLLTLRMSFLLPVVLWMAIALLRTAPSLRWRDWLLLAALGLLGNYGASILDFIGLQYISAALERLILFTYPTVTLLMGAVIYRQAITRRQVGAMLLCYAGIAAAFGHDLRLAGFMTPVLIGAALVFSSGVCYALYLSGSAGMIARIGTARFTALALLVSTALTFAQFLIQHPVAVLTEHPMPVYGYALGMGLLSTAMPVFAQSAAIRRIGSGESAMVSMIGPLLTIAFAAALLDEGFSMPQLIGVVLVLGGVASLGRK